MARHHVTFYLKREESPPVSLGTEDNVITVRNCLPDSDYLALIHGQTLPRQTHSMSRSSLPCSCITICQPDCPKSLREQLADEEREIERLQDKIGELMTDCRHSIGNITRIQEQLYLLEAKERAQLMQRKPTLSQESCNNNGKTTCRVVCVRTRNSSGRSLRTRRNANAERTSHAFSRGR